MFLFLGAYLRFQIEQGRLVTDTDAVQDDSQVYHEANTLNIDDEVHLMKEMEKSIVVHDENHEPMMVNEADMDFKIPGLPHSVVKHAQSTSVREMIQKIENHPNRHALQQDIRQNQSFNPLSRIKTNNSGCWEHRIMRITRDGTQNAVHSMFIILEHWYPLLYVRALLA